MSEVETLPRLLAASQVCDFLGVSRTTLWRLEQDGHLVPVRLGTAVRYPAEEVHEYVERLKRRRKGDGRRREARR